MPHLFWDSCVFNAFLYEETQSFDVDSIAQYLDEAKAGNHKIYTSAVVLAEISASKIKKKGVGGPLDFINDFAGSIYLIDANVQIFDLAGKLRDIPYKKGPSDKRRLSTGDAAMLATALYLQSAFGVSLDAFHTFDDGGKKREVPLLSYHEWCEGLTGAKRTLANQVVSLKREKPIHPTPIFKGIGRS